MDRESDGRCKEPQNFRLCPYTAAMSWALYYEKDEIVLPFFGPKLSGVVSILWFVVGPKLRIQVGYENWPTVLSDALVDSTRDKVM
jgi:hypothetical protein